MMLRFILIRFWPALIPIGLYLLWHFWRCKQAQKKGEEKPKHKGSHWFMVAMATLLLIMGSFLLLGLTGEKHGPSTYVPPHMENGAIVQGEIHADDADQR